MAKTAVDASRAGTVFALPPDDERFVLVNDPQSALYDERITLPVSDELALSIARDGQIQPGKVRKNGPKLEILDGRQRYRATLLVNQWVASNDQRVSFRAGVTVQFKFEVVKPEDEQDCIRKMLASNLRVDDTPLVRAKRVARALKWGLTEEDVRISYGFKSLATIQNILALLDCAPSVQQAVERRELPEAVARRFTKLEHTKQHELLAEMRTKGAMRGAVANRAVTSKKAGKEISAEKQGRRMLTREFIESYLLQLEDVTAPGVDAVRVNLRFLLGDADALAGAELGMYRDAVKRARRR